MNLKHIARRRGGNQDALRFLYNEEIYPVFVWYSQVFGSSSAAHSVLRNARLHLLSIVSRYLATMLLTTTR
jgi:hypothetical protein